VTEEVNDRMTVLVRQAENSAVAGGRVQEGTRNILVGYATRYGSTGEIAGLIADELRAAGYSIECKSLKGGGIRPCGYDAAVLGSPLYMGKWLAEAREYVSRERVCLSRIPVAVFCVGYSFRDQSPASLQAGCEALSEVRALIPVRDMAFFPGRVDHSRVSPADRAILALAKVIPGDFRDDGLVRSYARRLPGILGL